MCPAGLCLVGALRRVSAGRSSPAHPVPAGLRALPTRTSAVQPKLRVPLFPGPRRGRPAFRQPVLSVTSGARAWALGALLNPVEGRGTGMRCLVLVQLYCTGSSRLGRRRPAPAPRPQCAGRPPGSLTHPRLCAGTSAPARRWLQPRGVAFAVGAEQMVLGASASAGLAWEICLETVLLL